MEATKRPWLMNLLLKMRKYKVTLRLKDCEYEELFRIIDAHDDLLAACELAKADIMHDNKRGRGFSRYTLDKLNAAIAKAKGEA